jgi:hypothetical protein
MMKLARALACALVVLGLTVGVVPAQDIYVGTVTQIDQPAQVIVFDDGRMYRVVPNTVVLVDNQPMMYTTLQPGARVSLRGGQPVMFRDGQYVIVSGPAVSAAPVVVAPGATTTTITTVTAPPPIVASATGVVAGYDPKTNVLVLTDGRLVQLTSKSAILVGGMPTRPEQLRPGMAVTVSAVNPVVYRDGRYVLLNEGFFDSGNGSAMTWDSKYSGYEADTDNAAMQPQGGG